jgi:accessory colonization factor AcfC
MTHNEIIVAFMKKTAAARKQWMATQSPEDLATWDKWIGAVACLADVMEEANKQNAEKDGQAQG